MTAVGTINQFSDNGSRAERGDCDETGDGGRCIRSRHHENEKVIAVRKKPRKEMAPVWRVFQDNDRFTTAVGDSIKGPMLFEENHTFVIDCAAARLRHIADGS